MKIIHCSDLRLDSAMESALSAVKAQERNAEICRTFSRMAEYAAGNGVTVVLIAGDLFDAGRITSRTADYLLSIIEQQSAVDFLYLRGSREESKRAFMGRDLPKNLKTFSDEWTYYQYGEVRIAGTELTDEYEDIYDALLLNKDTINIVMMYGQTAPKCGQNLVCLPKLRKKKIDYLALGSLHSYQTGELGQDSIFCYPGCLEGHGFDECGEKGFVLLETDGGKLTHSFIPFAQRMFFDVPVDITGLVTAEELQKAMETAAESIAPEHLVRFTLRGTYTLETQKDFRRLLSRLEGNRYFVEIQDESRLDLPRESYAYDISLRGEFIRTVMASGKSDGEKEEIIRWGMQALNGKEIVL
ncbi:MAG: metallophosphoesterase [Oscillospiraceae bacterium]|nr:metallophosphoesterase [Oscillospiraceae bacterium]